MGEAAVGLLRIDLGVVQDAELDRIEAELLRHLIHGDLKRHHAGRLTRCTHRVAFRKVERSEPHGHQAVCARVEQPRL